MEHSSARTEPSAPGNMDGSPHGAHTQPGWSTPVLPPHLGLLQALCPLLLPGWTEPIPPWALGDCTHIISVLWILNVFVLRAGIKRSWGMNKDCLSHWEVLLQPRHL